MVGYRGTKSVSYQEALAAIFIEGWIFIAISIVGIRQKLIALLPRSAHLPTWLSGCNRLHILPCILQLKASR